MLVQCTSRWNRKLLCHLYENEDNTYCPRQTAMRVPGRIAVCLGQYAQEMESKTTRPLYEAEGANTIPLPRPALNICKHTSKCIRSFCASSNRV